MSLSYDMHERTTRRGPRGCKPRRVVLTVSLVRAPPAAHGCIASRWQGGTACDDVLLDVNAMAAQAHMSRRTFDRQFRAATGDLPLQWLVRQRVLRAQQLLEGTDLSVDAVARRVAFADGVAFAAPLPAGGRRVAAGLPGDLPHGLVGSSLSSGLAAASPDTKQGVGVAIGKVPRYGEGVAARYAVRTCVASRPRQMRHHRISPRHPLPVPTLSRSHRLPGRLPFPVPTPARRGPYRVPVDNARGPVARSRTVPAWISSTPPPRGNAVS